MSEHERESLEDKARPTGFFSRSSGQEELPDALDKAKRSPRMSLLRFLPGALSLAAVIMIPCHARAAEEAIMILSNNDPSLAINAWGGARHGTVLRLNNGCTVDNPDCTWIYRDRMLISSRDPSLAINAWGGARHGTVLRLHNGCNPNNPDCTWTYRDGMWLSDRDPNLAINAWGGARHGTVLRLYNGCSSSNPDCTWSQ